jgi:hypothetical protein
MRQALITIIVGLATIVNTAALRWWMRVIAAIAAAAIALAVELFIPGCMSTTYLDGKTYSWRLDILAPIGATVAQPASTAATPTAATQPAT